jgi:hypothetical protein
VESLEDRTVPSTFVVTNLNDAGAGSLRDAIAQANADPTDRDTITFAVTGTLYLNTSLVPSTAMDIVGPGADLLTIRPADGAPDFRMVRIRNEVTDDPIFISGLTFSGGHADHGTAIDDHGSVTVTDCTFTGNTQTDPTAGGILYNINGGGRLNIIHCLITGNTGQHGVVYNEGSGTLTVTGCTITNNTTKLGGGIYSGGGTVTITETVVSGNRANAYQAAAGGGVYNLGTMTITSSTIRDNVAADGSLSVQTGWGGGLYNQGNLTITGSDVGANTSATSGGGVWNVGNSTIADSTIEDNRTTGYYFGYGGGVANDISGGRVGHLTISNSLVTHNTANFNGGGISNGGVLTVDACTVSENQATVWFGGGMYNDKAWLPGTGVAVITNTTIADNTARSGGGGIASEHGPVTLANCTVSGNSSFKGAGIYLDLDNSVDTSPNNVQIQNSTIAYNIAPPDPYHPGQGGGLFVTQGNHANAGHVRITNSTIARNSAASGAGGIRLSPAYYDVTIDLRLDNTIVAANAGPRGDIDGIAGSTVNASSSHNLIGNGSFSGMVDGVNGNIVGTTASPINPLLGPLQDNGGPTQTLALLAGSPAIDAGDNGAVTLPYDQRGPGFDRIANGTVDIGAYEVQALAQPPVLDPIMDQTVSSDQDTVVVPLSAADPGGLSVTFSATVQTLASIFQQQYGLFTGGNFYENYYGAGEKWVQGNGTGWYFILSDGSFYQWDGVSAGAMGTYLGNVGAACWNDPTLLTNPGDSHAAVSILDSVLTLTRDPGYALTLIVNVTATNTAGLSASQAFAVSVLS